jgi:ABC-type transport system involved in cytochrome c biogenesis permease subunit
MKPLLLMTLAAYVVAAVHYVVAFMHKRRSSERVAFMSLAVGFALHTASIIMDWVEDGHYPLFGLRETFSFLAWTLAVAYLLSLILTRYRTLALGSFTLPLVSILTFIALVARDRGAGSATSEIARSAGAQWLFPVHTTLLLFAYAAFFVVFAASIMYLPSLMTVNDIASHAAAIGFTLLTLGVLTGMLWSSERDGRLWHNDPKEIFAGITWLLYLILILYRSTASWRGRRAAWLGVIGFALVLCTFFGARLLGSYHVFGFWILDFGFWIGAATGFAFNFNPVS